MRFFLYMHEGGNPGEGGARQRESPARCATWPPERAGRASGRECVYRLAGAGTCGQERAVVAKRGERAQRERLGWPSRSRAYGIAGAYHSWIMLPRASDHQIRVQ
jgi:hypothetical protein